MPNFAPIPKAPSPARREAYLRELVQYCRIPSVSAERAHSGDCVRAAKFVRGQLEAKGFKARLIKTGSTWDAHPMVFAEYDPPGATSKTPTVMIYAHYDVQPGGDLKKWAGDPFKPRIVGRGQDRKIVCRGADDDKGQSWSMLSGLTYALEQNGCLPFRTVIAVDGQEENGSTHFMPALAKLRGQIRPDCILVCDTEQISPGVPAITYALRGIAYFELKVFGPTRAAHSGLWGGIGRNPGMELAHIISSMQGRDGRILINGFYDGIPELPVRERREIARAPFSRRRLLEDSGFEAFFGEPGFSPLERRWCRPTIDPHGSRGGFQGDGASTSIPEWRSEKFSFRLVPGQHGKNIERLVRRHIRSVAPRGLKWELETYHLSDAVKVVDPANPIVEAASQAMEYGFRHPAYTMREGASIPVAGPLQKMFNVPVLFMGVGRSTNKIHSPDEEFPLSDFEAGIRMGSAIPHYFDRYFQSRDNR